jgi:hypothetical protein
MVESNLRRFKMFKRLSVIIENLLEQEVRVFKQAPCERESAGLWSRFISYIRRDPDQMVLKKVPVKWQGERIPLNNRDEVLFIYLPEGVMCSLLVQTIQDVSLSYDAHEHCWVVSIRRSKGKSVTSPGDVNLTIIPPEEDDL